MNTLLICKNDIRKSDTGYNSDMFLCQLIITQQIISSVPFTVFFTGTEERCHVYDEIQGGAEFQVTNGEK